MTISAIYRPNRMAPEEGFSGSDGAITLSLDIPTWLFVGAIILAVAGSGRRRWRARYRPSSRTKRGRRFGLDGLPILAIACLGAAWLLWPKAEFGVWAILLVAIGVGAVAAWLADMASRRRADAALSQSLRAFNPGDRGEGKVSATLRGLGYEALGDVYLPIGSATTQIDHVVSVGSVVLAVETKRWMGLVSGGQDDEEWTIRGAKTIAVRNPLLQNEIHAAALRAAVMSRVETLVVMAGRASFPAGAPAGICQSEDLPESLAKIASAHPSTIVSRWRWSKLKRRILGIDRDGARAAHERTLRNARLH